MLGLFFAAYSKLILDPKFYGLIFYAYACAFRIAFPPKICSILDGSKMPESGRLLQLLDLDQLQLPSRRKIFAIYALTILMYTVASLDPNPRGGGQLPNPNECNSTLTSVTGGLPYPYIIIGPCAKIHFV